MLEIRMRIIYIMVSVLSNGVWIMIRIHGIKCSIFKTLSIFMHESGVTKKSNTDDGNCNSRSKNRKLVLVTIAGKTSP